jgi:hypothetical protein
MTPIPRQTIDFAYPYYDEYAHIQKLISSRTRYDIRKIIFNLGHYGNVKKQMTVCSSARFTIKDAIFTVETWLLEPLTNDEYTHLYNNWDLEYMSPNDRAMYCLRGDCLGKSKIITDIIIDSNGTLHIISDT